MNDGDDCCTVRREAVARNTVVKLKRAIVAVVLIDIITPPPVPPSTPFPWFPLFAGRMVVTDAKKLEDVDFTAVTDVNDRIVVKKSGVAVVPERLVMVTPNPEASDC